jgi:predicted phage baseplate assembly protein
MEFDFLPRLPKSDLDDRTFNDLVNECLLRIPRYCPEWTNFNASDPGITLIEMFAWLTDQMLLRFNQVPRRNYVAFLEMLGVRLQSATPAKANVTFYLSAAHSERYVIPAGIEVATERTETEEAIIFSTTHNLVIGVPVIRHFLTAPSTEFLSSTEEMGGQTLLRDRLANIWTQDTDGSWEGREQAVFDESPRLGNCFYLVFDAEEPLDGNVIALTLKGEAAESTGINPDLPPRHWEAWDGVKWQHVLRSEMDDYTSGFSFDGDNGQGSDISEADVILHLPQFWPALHFGNYHGRWLRCVHQQNRDLQSLYTRPPKLRGMATRSIGAIAHTHQCSIIRDELLGESDGNPGQKFQLESTMILPRTPEEHIVVHPPNGLPQIWQEVNDFSNSTSQDFHYTLDSITGEVQFGPLIREASMLKEDMLLRASIQDPGNSGFGRPLDAASVQHRENHYGAIPPKGATIRMSLYRTGGGQQGNVQAGTLKILKSAVPYVSQVTNHEPAKDGADAESLEEAVIRVPRLLRTRDRAVTAEDFESLALQASRSVARVRCPSESSGNGKQGIVNLIIVPAVDTTPIARGLGIHPDAFALTAILKNEVLSFLDERRLLGIQVKCHEPEYVGVSVQLEVGLEPRYSSPQAREEIEQSLYVQLYRFLNPVTGGTDGMGWKFGNPLYVSDIVSLLQNIPGIRYLGSVSLFELRYLGDAWVRIATPKAMIDPGPQGLLCSWHDPILRSAHNINIVL